MIFAAAEDAYRYVKKTPFAGPSFTLTIADGMTFSGRPDKMGAGMAIIVDAVLEKGFFPDGFEQNEGYRLYRYKRRK